MITTDELRDYLSFLGGHIYIQALVTVLLFFLIGKIADWIITGGIQRLTRRTRSDIDDKILELLHRPVFITVVLIGLSLAFRLVAPPQDLKTTGTAILASLAVIVWLFFFVRLATLLITWMTGQERRFKIVQPPTAPLFDIAAKTIIFGLAIYFVLVAWNVNIGAWLASAGILGLAIGLAAQDTFANLFAGFSIIADAPYKIGDYIVLDGVDRGRVTKIGLRSTRILTRDGIEVTVPNSIIAGTKIVNESGGPTIQRRLRVPIGVAYGSDVDRVEEVLMKVAEQNQHVSKNPATQIYFAGFGDSSLNFEVRCWIDHPESKAAAINDLNFTAYKALAEADIEIPFPKRDVYIRALPKEFLELQKRSNPDEPRSGEESQSAADSSKDSASGRNPEKAAAEE